MLENGDENLYGSREDCLARLLEAIGRAAILNEILVELLEWRSVLVADRPRLRLKVDIIETNEDSKERMCLCPYQRRPRCRQDYRIFDIRIEQLG